MGNIRTVHRYCFGLSHTPDLTCETGMRTPDHIWHLWPLYQEPSSGQVESHCKTNFEAQSMTPKHFFQDWFLNLFQRT